MRGCPTNSPGRTPIQIVGRFVVLFDFPGFLILHQPPERYGTWFESDQLPWSDTCPAAAPIALPRRSGWVSDQGSWSDTTIFHNTLVVGSSPTSSTTHSRATGESLPC